MKITILNSSEKHPINPWLASWVRNIQSECEVDLIRNKSQLVGGDILFLISCAEIVNETDRKKFKQTLVIHASDLPKGRGWSPHVWEILNGAEEITVSLLEGGDKVDSGDIWHKLKVKIPRTALYDEINKYIFNAEIDLMNFAVKNFNRITPAAQDSTIEPTYWRQRTQQDSELDISKTIDEQFDLIRVCDPHRYPAFFYKNGKKFLLRIELADE